MADASDFSDRMAELQRMRVALVVLTSQETAKLLSRRQRVAGKEIEVMTAERDHAMGITADGGGPTLEVLYREDAELRKEMAEVEADIARLDILMAKVTADIAALCQA
jgi:hypothetical protein